MCLVNGHPAKSDGAVGPRSDRAFYRSGALERALTIESVRKTESPESIGAWATIIILVSKVGCVLVVAVSFLFAFDSAQFAQCVHWPTSATGPTMESRLATWDSADYLALSQGGYHRDSALCAFYPLWPLMMRECARLSFGHPLIAGYMLANVLSFIALWLFHQLVASHYGERMSRNALILMLAFPGALFFNFIYTESLFLALVLAWFWFIERERYAWPALLGFVLPLTRAVGVFILVPLVWNVYEKKKPLRYWLLLLTPLAGYSAYFLMMRIWTGNPFEGFAAQKYYPNSPSISNMYAWHALAKAAVGVDSVDGMTDSILDRACFLLFLVTLPFIYKLNKTWFWYALPTGLVPALTSYFMSYRRYTIVCFPIFIVLAQWLAKSGSRWLFWYYVIMFGALQVWAITQFVNFKWAG